MEFSDQFYRKVYPPEVEKDKVAFDFGTSTVLAYYLRQSRKLMHSKGALPEHVMLARVEIGLYHPLHRLRARVHTSRIVPRLMDDQRLARCAAVPQQSHRPNLRQHAPEIAAEHQLDLLVGVLAPDQPLGEIEHPLRVIDALDVDLL